MPKKYSWNDVVEGLGGAGLMGLHMLLLPLLSRYRTRWGASDEEINAAYPGDEQVPHPKINFTHAISIPRPPAEVWPWIVQIGQGRGGFYSYQFLENIVGCEIYNTRQVLPQYQQLPLQEGMRLHPDMPPMQITAHQDGHYYFLHGSQDTGTQEAFDPRQDPYPEHYMCVGWLFHISPQDNGQTRLVSRWLADYDSSLLNNIAYKFFLEPIAFAMMRKMLLGIRQCASQATAQSPKHLQ